MISFGVNRLAMLVIAPTPGSDAVPREDVAIRSNQSRPDWCSMPAYGRPTQLSDR
jgi:hypothetical protein